MLADLGEPRGSEAGGRRPVVIVSHDALNRVSERLGRGTVTIAPVTSNVRQVLPFHVPIDAGSAGLDRPSKVQAEQVRTVSVGRLGPTVGRLPDDIMRQLDDALRLHLDL